MRAILPAIGLVSALGTWAAVSELSSVPSPLALARSFMVSCVASAALDDGHKKAAQMGMSRSDVEQPRLVDGDNQDLERASSYDRHILVSGLSWVLSPLALAGSSMVSEDELRACVASAALEGGYENAEQMGMTRSDVEQSYLIDGDDHALEKARSYDSGILAGKTVYHEFLVKGSAECALRKATGRKIAMPEVSVKADCRIVRHNGSAAEVCGNDPEPEFGCMTGYHPTGSACVADDPSDARRDAAIEEAIRP